MPTALAVSETSERILDIAEHLIQTRGFNGFSYADIAAELKITKASLHYHFQTKTRLGESLVDRYHGNFLQLLADIDKRHEHALDKLRAYAKIYTKVLEAGRLCLCGMLASDYATLPESLQERVRHFFEANELWLKNVLANGREKNEIAFASKPLDAARYVIGTLEGAMLIARTLEDPGRFRSSIAVLLNGFATDARHGTLK